MGKRFGQPVVTYVVAIAATALLVCFRLSLPGLLGDRAPFVPFILPIVVAGWWGGLKPGLLATALGCLAIDYFFLAPLYSLPIGAAGDGAALATFFVCGVIVSLICESMHVA